MSWMRVAGLAMLFCVFFLLNLELLTHARHRRQEIDARDMAASGRIYKPWFLITPSSPSHTYFPGIFSKSYCAGAHVAFSKPETMMDMSVPRSSSSFQNAWKLARMCRAEIFSSWSFQKRATKITRGMDICCRKHTKKS